MTYDTTTFSRSNNGYSELSMGRRECTLRPRRVHLSQWRTERFAFPSWPLLPGGKHPQSSDGKKNNFPKIEAVASPSSYLFIYIDFCIYLGVIVFTVFQNFLILNKIKTLENLFSL